MKKEDIVKLFPIETERCWIRRPTLDDVDAVYAAMQERDEDLRKWMSWSNDQGMSREGVAAFIVAGLDATATTDIPLFAYDKISGAFAVASGIHGEDDQFLTSPTGWWIARNFEGQGYAFEVMKALIDVSFQKIGTQTITTQYYADNQRSKNLMERLGFHYVETVEKAHRCHLDGTLMDVHKYSMEIKNE